MADKFYVYDKVGNFVGTLKTPPSGNEMFMAAAIIFIISLFAVSIALILVPIYFFVRLIMSNPDERQGYMVLYFIVCFACPWFITIFLSGLLCAVIQFFYALSGLVVLIIWLANQFREKIKSELILPTIMLLIFAPIYLIEVAYFSHLAFGVF